MDSLQSFIKFLPPVMSQLLDLHIFDNMQFVLGAVACLGVVGVVTWACLLRSERGLPLPPSPPTWRLRGHSLNHRK